jgi:hypothetical protein
MSGRICVKEGFAPTLFEAARKSLILNGEMSEWSIEHAWKLIPLARADAHQIPPTEFRGADLERTLVDFHPRGLYYTPRVA